MAEQHWRDRERERQQREAGYRQQEETWRQSASGDPARRPQRYGQGEGERLGEEQRRSYEEERRSGYPVDESYSGYPPGRQAYGRDPYGRDPYGRDPYGRGAPRGEDERYGERPGPGGFGAFPGGGHALERDWRAAYGPGAGRQPVGWGEDYGEGWRAAREPGRGDYRGAYRDADRDQRRDWWDRASDEVSSWFGDEAAERRREQDRNHRGRGPKGYVRSDERIREDVSDRLADDWRLDASELEVTVSACEVTLSGSVASREEKRRAEDLAESVSGVKHVQNNLRVQQPGNPPLGTATTALGAAATLGGANGNGNTAPGGKRSGL